MRILIVMDPGIPVPPVGYGGIERIVALLAVEYQQLGHQVDLIASEGSYIEGCSLFPSGKEGFPPGKKEMNKAIFRVWKLLIEKRNQYDLVHNFGRLLYLLPILNNRVKKIQCYQREITTKNIEWITHLPNKNLVFSGCSANLIERANPPGKWIAIHNAVNFSQYSLEAEVEIKAPLIFLGRIERIKGCHTAIQVARQTNNKLIIAGNVSQLSDEYAYFKTEIEPEIDGEQIVYVGQVNDFQKNQLLGSAKALLMPIEWNEPFGIVMIEAMVCGTPVIGFNKGSVAEVITNGITGFIVENMDEMIAKVAEVHTIDRTSCRERAQQQFDVPVVAQAYLMCHC